ncbi:hypothetical protein [Klebsiella huaxiensis]|uniref:hypothetical protein n=1 Tax=Klebsiella huaxiensis TaxID=2153354 RepID=UPI00115799D2|nr:hypothetical protein [Klebsiella huaxiensis]
MAILNGLQMITIFKLLACWLRSFSACGNGNIQRCQHYAHHFIHHQRDRFWNTATLARCFAMR